MYIFCIKDGHIFATMHDEHNDSEYTLLKRDDMPEYPCDGNDYILDIVDGEPSWVQVEHRMTAQEQIDALVNGLGI